MGYKNSITDINSKVGINQPVPTEALDVIGNAIVTGNVGIGTASPGAYKLNVAGTGYFSGEATFASSGIFGGAVQAGGFLTVRGSAPFITFKNSAGTPLGTIQHNESNLLIDPAVGITNIIGDLSTTGAATFASSVTAEKSTFSSAATSAWITTIRNSAATGSSYGLTIEAGTNASDLALAVRSKAVVDLMVVRGDGNVGIGTPSPSAKLEVNVGLNSLKISGRNTYVDSSEDATNANIYVTQDGVGDFGQLAGNLVLQARTQGTVYRDIIFAGGLSNGDALMTILGEGNVGIGATGPVNKLNVNGDIGYTGVIGQGSIYGNTGNASYATMQLYNSANGYTTLNNQSYGYYFNTSGGTKLTILNNGNVGIGTANPGKILHLASDTTSEGLLIDVLSSPTLTLRDRGNSDTILGVTGTAGLDNFFISTYGKTNALVIKGSNGNVGIGTTNPGGSMGGYGSYTKLDVVSSGNQGWLRVASGATGVDVASIWLHPFDFGNAGWQMGTNNDGKLRLGYGSGASEEAAVTSAKDGSSGITIQTNGNVGIGTTTPTLAKLQVAGTGYFSGAVNIAATTASTSSTTGALIVAGGVGIGKALFIGGDVSTGIWIEPRTNNHWIDGSIGEEYKMFGSTSNVWTNAAHTTQASTGLMLGITTSNLLANANTTDPKGFLYLKGKPCNGIGSMNNIWLVGGNATDAVSQINSRLQVGFDQWSPNLSNTDTLYVGGTGKFTSTVTALNLIKSGGTSSQYLMADGSVSSGTSLPYAVYTALISQSATAAPVPTILENGIGAIVWTRAQAGYYQGTLTGAFPLLKTIVFITSSHVWSKIIVSAGTLTANVIQYSTTDYSGTLTDGNGVSIEIRVYP